MADAVEEGKALRKDEELEAEAAAARLPESDFDAIKNLAHTIDIEEELKDDELLGEATLAKLSPIPGTEEPALKENIAEETGNNEAIDDEDAGKEKKE
jgi:hypothetical protein